jgi:S-adenosylmethionine:tRNA ribosyltransferase-isomerase
MLAGTLDYELPPELIAQHPAEPRDSARLLVHDRRSGTIRHRVFRDLMDELDPADLIVVNDTRVLPVRVRARRDTGGAAEVLLLEPVEDGAWEALVRPYRRLREGETLHAGSLGITIQERLGEGRALVRPAAETSLEAALDEVGEMPLPPYITDPPADRSSYQTVYARDPGSAAAPTAGLHFTEELWGFMHARHEVVAVTLDVGLDTFRPLTAEVVEQHPIHSERYHMPEMTAVAVTRAREQGRRIVAIGTTTVRVLETVFGDPRGELDGRSRLLITPGHVFRATGAMVTNFHLPRSTLLALVMAFAGVEATRDLYRTAVSERYRFYSFGDAVLIL